MDNDQHCLVMKMISFAEWVLVVSNSDIVLITMMMTVDSTDLKDHSTSFSNVSK